MPGGARGRHRGKGIHGNILRNRSFSHTDCD
jgi:hypothetical protein